MCEDLPPIIYISLMFIRIVTFIMLLSTFGTSKGQSDITVDQNLKFSLNVGTMAFLRNENLALLDIMSNRYLTNLQTQHTGIDPTNQNALLLELGFEKTIKKKWSINGRLSFRSFDEGVLVMYKNPEYPENSDYRAFLSYSDAENHISMGVSVSLNILKEKSKYKLSPYTGADFRKSEITQISGTVQWYENGYKYITNLTYNDFTKFYTEDRVHVDPIVGVKLQRGMIITDIRAQTFVKNKFRGDNNFFPDVKDQTVLFSFSLGLVF